MKKLRFTKLGSLFLGLSMGLGVAAGLNIGKKSSEVKADSLNEKIYESGTPSWGTTYFCGSKTLSNVSWYVTTGGNNSSVGWNKATQDYSSSATMGPVSNVSEDTKYGMYMDSSNFANAMKITITIVNADSVSGNWYIFGSTDSGTTWTQLTKNTLSSTTTTLEYASTSIIGSNVRFGFAFGTDATTKTRITISNIVVYNGISGGTPDPEKTLESIAISGDMTKTSYTTDDAAFDPTGLVATGHYSDNSDEVITDDVTWTIDPSTPTADVTEVSVKASLGSVESEAYKQNVTVIESTQKSLTLIVGDYATENNWQDSKQYKTITKGDVTLVANGGGNTGKYYNSDKTWRIYGSESGSITISIADGFKISEIVSNPANTFTIASDKKTAVFSAPSGSTVKFKSFTINYEKIVVSPLLSISVSSDHREFYQDDTFVPETVTATYENGDTATVEATFSGYDLSTVGTQTVSVSYSEREVTRTTTYQITVLADTLNSITLGGTVSGSLNQDWDLSGVTATANYSHKGAVILTDFEPTTENAKPTAYGTYPVVVSVLFDGVTGTNTYEVEVKKDGRDPNNPFTAEEAAAITEATTFDVYVKGVVTQVDEISLDHGNTTFWIGENNAFKVYRAVLDSSLGTLAEDTIVEGQTVTVKGKINMYNSTSQLGQGSVIVEIIQSSNIPLTGISVTPAELTLIEGKTSQLTVTFEPFNASNKDVIFVSDDDSIATVSDEGLVTAIAVGTTTITVVSDEGEFEDTCSVTVTEPVDVTGTYKLYSGELTEGDYLITYDNGAMKASITSSRLDFASITPIDNKVTVSDSSIIWHIAPTGDYWTIYNENEGKYAIGTGTANKGGLGTDGSADGALWTASGEGTYEFVNKLNASKSVNSNLRRNGDYGFACYATGTGEALTLYKKSNGVVNVESVSLNETETTLEVGKTLELTATVLPADADDKSVTWESSNTSVATVSDGVVTAVAEGDATITVTTTDGGKTANCAVKVETASIGETENYALVTSADELVAGDKLLIVGFESEVYYAVAPYESGSNCKRAEVPTPMDDVISLTDENTGYAQLTLGGAAGNWTLFDGTYYLYAAGGTGSNQLKGTDSTDALTAQWSISVANDGVATIKCADTATTRNTIRHNTSNDLFACYASGQADVYLYKLVEDTPVLADGRYYLMSADGHYGLSAEFLSISGKTSPAAVDLTASNELNAFNVKYNTENKGYEIYFVDGGLNYLQNSSKSTNSSVNNNIRISDGTGYTDHIEWILEPVEGGFIIKQNTTDNTYRYLGLHDNQDWYGYLDENSATVVKFVEEGSIAADAANSILNDLVCDNGVTPPSVEVWNSIASSLTIAHEKALLANGTANASSESEIEKALAKYDYIVGKYGSSTYADFLDRGPTSPARYGLSLGLDELKDSTWIVAVVAIAGLTAIGGCFFYRKRKQY